MKEVHPAYFMKIGDLSASEEPEPDFLSNLTERVIDVKY